MPLIMSMPRKQIILIPFIISFFVSIFAFGQSNLLARLKNSDIIRTPYRIDPKVDDCFPSVYFRRTFFLSNTPEQFSLGKEIKEVQEANHKIYGVIGNKIKLGDQSSPSILKVRDAGSFTFIENENDLLVTLNRDPSTKKPGNTRISRYQLKEGFWVKVPFELFDTMKANHSYPFVFGSGKKMVFSMENAENKSFDIYESNFENNRWTKPKNLGSSVNSLHNEWAPFVDVRGELFFISDRKGTRDIFFSDTKTAVPLTSINTLQNETGFFWDPVSQTGYVSVEQNGQNDIYKLSLISSGDRKCEKPTSDNLCYEFEEASSVGFKENDSTIYEWDFGDGMKQSGLKVEHCYKNTGQFVVRLNIIDKISGVPFYNQTEYVLEVAPESKVLHKLNHTNSNRYHLAWNSRSGDNSISKTYLYKGNNLIDVIEESQFDFDNKFLPFRIMHFLPNDTVCYLLTKKEVQEMLIEKYGNVDTVKRIVEPPLHDYKISIGNSNKFYPNLNEDYRMDEPVEIVIDSSRKMNYYIGKYSTINEAIPNAKDLRKKGFDGAEVVSTEKGKSNVSKRTMPYELGSNIHSESFDFHFSLFYEKNKSEIREEYIAELKNYISSIKKKSSIVIQLSSYTDNTGNAARNKQLIDERTAAVKKYFLENFGIPGSSIIVKPNPKGLNAIVDPKLKLEENQRRSDIYIRLSE